MSVESDSTLIDLDVTCENGYTSFLCVTLYVSPHDGGYCSTCMVSKTFI